MLATDRLDLMKLFVRIAETGTLTEAARSLGLSQPSASRCLRQLETLLDARLVQRSAKGAGLTPSGHALLPHARRLLMGWGTALEAVGTDRQVIAGALRIAAPVAIGQSLLASIAARFINQHPGITIDWHLRDDAIDPAGSGYDLWIRAGEVRRDDLVVHTIYSVQRAIVAAPTHASVTHPGELLPRAAVRLSTFVPAAVALTQDGGPAFILKQRTVFTTDSLHAAYAAVLEGVGYAVLPLWLVQADANGGKLVQLCPGWRPADVLLSLAYPPNPKHPARVDAFAHYLRSELTRQDGLGLTFLEATQVRHTVTVTPPASRRSRRGLGT